MLQIEIPESEYWDDKNSRFVLLPAVTLNLEHSLVSLSKWEMKWKKPFLSKDQKTPEQIVDYIKCMTITQNVDPDVYSRLTRDNYKKVQEYIEDPMTATWFSKNQQKQQSRKIITSERIYSWMISAGVPFECQKWHLNRLLTLIQVCNIEGQPPKKMNRNELYSRNSALNAARRNKLNSRG